MLDSDANAAGPNAGLLATLVYTSRATGDFAGPALAGLVEAAQERNAEEGVTGCLIYDRGRFLQWLEGPRAGMDRITGSIRSDPRHTDISVLADRSTRRRIFSGWSLRLSVGPDAMAGDDVLAAPFRLLERLHAAPDRTPGLVRLLAATGRSPTALREPATGLLDNEVVRCAIHASLERRLGRSPARHSAARRDAAILLSAMAVDGDLDGCTDAIDGSTVPALAPARAATTLLEATVARLGAAWRADLIAEHDTTIATGTLLLAFRRVALRRFHHPWPTRGQVLVATAPGEPHLLQSAMAEECLLEAGFDAGAMHPATVDDMQAAVAGAAPRCLVITTSTVQRRDERMKALAAVLPGLRCGPRTTIGLLGFGVKAAGGSSLVGNAGFCTETVDRLLRAVSQLTPSATGSATAFRSAGESVNRLHA
jgi:hypothetical protein